MIWRWIIHRFLRKVEATFSLSNIINLLKSTFHSKQFLVFFFKVLILEERNWWELLKIIFFKKKKVVTNVPLESSSMQKWGYSRRICEARLTWFWLGALSRTRFELENGLRRKKTESLCIQNSNEDKNTNRDDNDRKRHLSSMDFHYSWRDHEERSERISLIVRRN